MILASAVLLGIASPQPSGGIAGVYLTNQMEMAGALDLQPDGRFRYRLDYGAVSEEGEGEWASDGRSVLLTSMPMPELPAFTLVRDDPAPKGQLFVALDNPDLRWSPLEVEVTLAVGGRRIIASAGGNGRVDLPDGVRAAAVKMLLPIYETGGEPVMLTATTGHRLLFRLAPNDFGKAAFRGQALPLDAGSIIMHRYETTIVFRRSDK